MIFNWMLCLPSSIHRSCLVAVSKAESRYPGSMLPQAPQHAASVDLILNQQLENADVVVLNKIDDLTEDSLMKAEELVRQKAPKVRFLELAHHAELDTRLCHGIKFA